MFDWKQMKIRSNDNKKAASWAIIERKMAQPKSQWKPILAVIGVLMLTMLLFFIWPQQQQVTSNPLGEIKQIYVTQEEGLPTSLWRAGVEKIRDSAILQQYEVILKEMQSTDEVLPKDVFFTGQFYTLQLFMQDGTKRLLDVTFRFVEEQLYIQDLATGESYIYAMDEESLLQLGTKMYELFLVREEIPWIWLASLVIVFLLQWPLRKWIWPRDEEGREEPTHSTPMQSGVHLLGLVMMLAYGLIAPNPHFLVLLLIMAVTTLVKMMLEHYHGKATWRMILFILEACYFLYALFVILYIL